MEKSYEKKTSKLQILEFENGVILPRKEIEEDYPMWGLGGVCDEKNEFVKESFYDGDWATHGGKYEWNEEEFINDDVVYIGMFYAHWGHFLVDLSNRFWAIPKIIKENPNIKIAYLGEETPQGNNLRFFNLLGVKKEQLFHIEKPTRFKKVYVPEQSFKPNTWFTDEFVEGFSYIANQAIASSYDFSRVRGIDKVYFTRRSYQKAVSSEFGEEFFEEYFKFNGYTVLSPEKLELEEQIYLWNKADSIACINGAITQNILFCCNKDLKWIVLNKTSIFHENPRFFQYTRGVEGHFLNVFNEPFKRYPKSLGEGPFLLQYTDEFIDFANLQSLKAFQSDELTKKQFNKLKLKYLLSIISIKKRIKNLLFKIYYKIKSR